MTQRSAESRRIALWRWPLIGLRIALMGLALVISAPLYYLSAPFFARNPVPRLFLGALARIVGVKLRSTGERPASRSFLLANHVSWIDILALAGTTGCAFVAHDGLAAIGPLRWLCGLNDTVFVARHDRRSVARQIEQVRTALQDTGSLAIFPEGTTSDGTSLLPFKSSLLSSLEAGLDHIAVQPVWLDYGVAVQDVAWIGSESGLENALRLLGRIRPIPLTLHFLPPLEGEDRAQRKAIARAAQNAVMRAMDRRDQRVAL